MSNLFTISYVCGTINSVYTGRNSAFFDQFEANDRLVEQGMTGRKSR